MAISLLARHGAQILATARRYAASPEDAEDAYQRGLEILLTKAPTTREAELVPWLKTVVKHEAFALRRQRERHTPVSGDGEPAERDGAAATTHEAAERYERLRHGAEALRRLKPQEVRCLVLKARGLSYREICAETGFSYTKVNRCLTEGRQALAARVAGIEAGAECERLAPILSALADGEADAQALAALRPHMRTCLACRARLREFREAPDRVAALVLPAALAAADGGHGGGLRSVLESALGAAQHKAAALGERAHGAVEMATGQKVAAVAASAAAIAGGGTAAERLSGHQPGSEPPPAQQRQRDPAAAAPLTVPPSPAAPPAEQPAPAPATGAPQPAATQPEPEPPPPPDPADEFTPGAGAPEATAATAAAASPSPQPTRQRAPAGPNAAEFVP